MTDQGLEQRFRDSVDYLCSDECLPRNPGTGGGTAARSYLGEKLADLDLEPLGERGYLQPIPKYGRPSNPISSSTPHCCVPLRPATAPPPRARR